MRFVEKCVNAIGEDLVGVLDNYRSSGRIGFATKEPDLGDYVKAKYLDAVHGAAKESGLRAVVMPFPVNGKILYEAVIVRR